MGYRTSEAGTSSPPEHCQAVEAQPLPGTVLSLVVQPSATADNRRRWPRGTRPNHATADSGRASEGRSGRVGLSDRAALVRLGLALPPQFPQSARQTQYIASIRGT